LNASPHVLNTSTEIVAEEIMHIYYWNFIEKELKWKIKDPWEVKGRKWRAWHIAELVPEYVLIEDKELKEYWLDKIDRSIGYPWIPELRKISDPIWNNKKSIKDFLIKLHRKCGCIPKMQNAE